MNLNCMFNCTFLLYDSKFMLLKTLTLYFSTGLVYFPFSCSLLSMNCQLPGMLMCFSGFCKLAFTDPLPTAPSSSPSLHLFSCLIRIPLWGLFEFLQSPRLITQFSLAGLRSLSALPIALLTIQASSSLLRVQIPDPLSNAQKTINLKEAECSERWLEITKKKRDLEREEKIVEALCLFLSCSSLFSS